MRVLMRAIWRRTRLISAVLSSWPVALRKRRLSASCFVARSSSISSVRFMSLSRVEVVVRAIADPFSDRLVARDHARLDRQLLDGLLERRLGELGVRVRELEQHPPGPHDGDPELGVALARTHAGLGRLLGDGLVGEDVDPDLAAALDLARHGDTGGLDLAGGQPAR